MKPYELGPAEQRRHLRLCGNASQPELMLDGRKVIQFASNNYLGLSTHPRVIAAMQKAAQDWGTGSGAAPLITGHQSIHAELEAALAKSKGAEAALLFPAGSLANLGCLSALASGEDQIFLDKVVHATLYDGARLSGAGIARFPHQDTGRLETLLRHSREVGTHRVVIAVDAVYSMDGDIAPLPDLLALAKEYDAVLVVDEAHSTGVLGSKGLGILEHFGIKVWPENLVLTGTLSKALGSQGGYVAASRSVIEYLVNQSRSFIFGTALAGPSAAAALEALDVIGSEPQWLTQLWANTKKLRDGLTALGWDCSVSETPILPLQVGTAERALALQARMLDAGFFIPAIRPPTVPAGACRLRLSVSASHSDAQIEGLLKALGKP